MIGWLRDLLHDPEGYKAGPVSEPDLQKTPIRPKCPFYGFIETPCGMMDCSGNGCGLAGDHTPCRMEMHNTPPDWDACLFFNHKRNRERLQQLMEERIFPNELHPKGAASWEGITIGAWFRQIMGRSYP